MLKSHPTMGCPRRRFGFSTNDDGYVEFGLADKGFYAVVIKFEAHEEILYQELMSPGASYVYTPDPSITNGRLMVLSEE